VRKRVEARLRKRLRHVERSKPELVAFVQQHQHAGLSLDRALRTTAEAPSVDYRVRADAARVLALANPRDVPACLLRQFFSQTNEKELWDTALALECLGHPSSVAPMIAALNDANVDRRHAAAHALGWSRTASARAAKALTKALLDPTQPVAVRSQAAESLGYLNAERAIPALIAMSEDADAEIRFWSVVSLGTISHTGVNREAALSLVTALESRLADDAIPGRGWWSVRREALAQLGSLHLAEGGYAERLSLELAQVKSDAEAPSADRRWADFYSR
jgi:HEAT repeat protein